MQTHPNLSILKAEIDAARPARAVGRIARAGGGLVEARGLSHAAALGDLVRIDGQAGRMRGEIVEVTDAGARILPEGTGEGLRIGEPVVHLGPPMIAPHDGWIGRVVDGNGQPLDGQTLARGPQERALRAPPPDAMDRRRLGARLATGLAVFDTLLPIVRGQRLGIFSGAGVGKSSLLAALGTGVEADVLVLALVGERGREVREFVERSLDPETRARSVVIAATSDRPPLVRRRALWTAMAAAEHFRDAGRHVLLTVDSVTRFAEAHREIALAAGEAPSLHGHPPSLVQEVMSLAERAGPGAEHTGGDITALFTVLVPGEDMNEPVADVLRAVLDGHIVLDRAIAERGRFPAVDILRSVSRSLPHCASEAENALITLARRRLGAYDQAELMVQSGLYVAGTDPEVDTAVSVWPKLDGFAALTAPDGPEAAFAKLSAILGARSSK